MRRALVSMVIAAACTTTTPSTKETTAPLPQPAANGGGNFHGGKSAAPAGVIVDAASGKPITYEQMIRELSTADGVYVGEMHDDRAQHDAQLWVLKGLFYARPGEVAVGMEMFQKPFQEVLDLYIAGEIGEAALIRNSEYEKRWGYEFGLYRPILRFALDHKVRVLALNSPTELVRKISAGGIEGLSPADKAELPEMDLTDAAHRARIKASFDQHPHGGNFERFYSIQTLWDETMAQTAADYLRGAKGSLIVVLAGHGHIDNGNGIPNRVARRVPGTHKIVVPVSVPRGEKVDIQALQQEKLGDYLWLIEVEPEEEDNNPHKGLPPGTPNPHKKPGA